MILKLFILIMIMSMINVSQRTTVNAQEITNLPTFEPTHVPTVELTPAPTPALTRVPTPVPTFEPTPVPTLVPTPVPTLFLVPPNNAIPSNVTDSINEAIVAFSELQILITTLSSAGGILVLFIAVYLFIKFNGRRYIYLPSINSKSQTEKTDQSEQSKETDSKNITNINLL
jgi:hypothetical protein